MCENAHATCRCDDLAPLLIVDLDCDKQKKAENAFDVFKHQDDTHDMKLHEAFKEIFAACLTMVAIDDTDVFKSIHIYLDLLMRLHQQQEGLNRLQLISH